MSRHTPTRPIIGRISTRYTEPNVAGSARLSLGVLALLLSGCATPQEPATSVIESAPEVVTSFPASTGLSFGLAPGKCVEGKCAAIVQLLRSGKVIDAAPLGFAASGAQLNKGVAEKILGATDPLDESDQLPTWTAGEGEASVTTAARSVKLSAGQFALLVDQTGGFEHVKRRHYLFISDDNTLKRVWTGEEGAGPAWSAAILVDSADGSGRQIVYLTGFQPGGENPDTLDAKRYGWDAAQKTLVERPLGALYAIVAGNFANVQAARAASAQPCLADYSAVPGRDLGIPGSRIVLAAVTTQKSLAEAALGKMDNCPASLTRRIVTVNLAARKP